MEDNDIINGNCWVAYFDILGFEREVNIAEREGEGRVLHAFNKALEEIGLHKSFEKEGVNTVWFSDTFIFYSFNDSPELINIVAQNFSKQMFSNLIPLRGCLNFGRFYADKKRRIYYGSALIEAYKLAESQDWIGYILSKKAVEKMKECYTEDGRLYWNVCKSSYEEYDVPVKDRKEKLPAYKMGFCSNRPPTIVEDLYYYFTQMLNFAKHGIESDANLNREQKQRLLEKVKRKYKNTNDFLLKISPSIGEKTRSIFLDSLCSLWLK